MKRNIFFGLMVFMIPILIVSCIKDQVEPLGDAGKTFIKFNDAPSKTLFFNPFDEVKKVTLFSLRKDANSGAELSTTTSVSVKSDPQLITSYNTKNGTNYEVMPADFFTFDPDAGVTNNNGQFTFNFGSGDFAKNMNIQLNGSKWNSDLSKKYAFAFVIADAGGKTLTTGKDTIITLLSIKNKWDGVYEVSGTMTDVVSPGFVHISIGLAANGYDPLQIELRTVSATKCAVFVPLYNLYASQFYNSGTGQLSRYSFFSVVVEFDPNTDEVISVTNYSGQQAGTTKRSGKLDPSGENKYDPATKTVTIKYNMLQEANLDPPLPAPFIRTTWDEKWKFVKDRN